MDTTSAASSSLISQFHLGVSADGRECLLVFVDKEQNAMKCVATFPEFRTFVSSLCDIANEMARRQTEGAGRPMLPHQMLDVAAGAFSHDQEDGCIKGALVGPDGNMLGVRMSTEVASQLSRALLLASPAVLAS